MSKMPITIKLTRIEITGEAVLWDEKDPGFKNFAGSVYFENLNYFGFLRHDGMVELQRNHRKFGVFKPENIIAIV